MSYVFNYLFIVLGLFAELLIVVVCAGLEPNYRAAKADRARTASPPRRFEAQ